MLLWGCPLLLSFTGMVSKGQVSLLWPCSLVPGVASGMVLTLSFNNGRLCPCIGNCLRTLVSNQRTITTQSYMCVKFYSLCVYVCMCAHVCVCFYIKSHSKKHTPTSHFSHLSMTKARQVFWPWWPKGQQLMVGKAFISSSCFLPLGSGPNGFLEFHK